MLSTSEFFTAPSGRNWVLGFLSSCANPLQVFTPAQCHPVGRSGCPYRYRVCIWPEWGGEPAKREPEGALPLSHAGVRGQPRGWRGLHPVLYQRYDGVGVEHSSWGGGGGSAVICPIYVVHAHKQKNKHANPLTLGPPRPGVQLVGTDWTRLEHADVAGWDYMLSTG